MAVSFNKEVILEAIQEVLAEDQKIPVRVSSKSDPSDTGSIEVMDRDKMNALKRTGKVEIDPMEEDHHENPNDDSDMAKSQLYAIAKYALELLQMIKDGDPLDAWVQAKITKAADYVDAVQHYLEGEEYLDANQGESEEDVVNEFIYYRYPSTPSSGRKSGQRWYHVAYLKDGKPTRKYSFDTKEKALAYIKKKGEGYYLADRKNKPIEELAESDYQARTKEDLVYQYLRDAWQFGATKGRDVNPDEELSTMADSLLANLPDYDNAEVSETLELDEIKAGEFAKIKKGTKIGMKGYGYVTVLDNDGVVLKVKDQFGEVFPINLGQYNEKALTEGVSCCGRCGRVHESAQDCKKPYISKDSPRHCKNKK